MAHKEQSENLKKALMNIAEKMAATRECLNATEVKIKSKRNKLVSTHLTHTPNPDNPMMTYFEYPPPSLINELYKIACALVVDGKGIFGTYDSDNMLDSRLYNLNLENIPEQRRKYRQLLFTTNIELSNYVSGMFLTEGSVHQKSDEGVSFIELLKERSIIPGVIGDSGVATLFGSLNECITEGLTDLGHRCVQFKKDGIQFVKWRCFFKIGTHTPSYHAIIQNSYDAGRFSCICQANRLVPVIQIDILEDGNYTTVDCQKASETIVAATFKAFHDHHVVLEGILLKFNVVMQGRGNPVKSSHEEVAAATLTALSRTVPCIVPGILFSGGEDELGNTVNLDIMNRSFFGREKPWKLTFGFGRIVLDAILNVWDGKDENVAAAQAKFLQLAKYNSDATYGQFEIDVIPTQATIIEPDIVPSTVLAFD